jgi:hypothetical protein
MLHSHPACFAIASATTSDSVRDSRRLRIPVLTIASNEDADPNRGNPSNQSIVYPPNFAIPQNTT